MNWGNRQNVCVSKIRKKQECDKPPFSTKFLFLLANNIIEMLNIRSLVGFNEQP